jgi:hypothetical protein
MKQKMGSGSSSLRRQSFSVLGNFFPCNLCISNKKEPMELVNSKPVKIKTLPSKTGNEKKGNKHNQWRKQQRGHARAQHRLSAINGNFHNEGDGNNLCV